MDDSISRKMAIKAIDDFPNCYNGYSDTHDKAYIIGVLEELPSAVKHGHWIENGYGNGEIVCSNCGEPCATFSMMKPRDRFCKWCGARMEGEDDETD